MWRRRRTRPEPAERTCSCGRPLDPVDMDYGFSLPDRVFALSPQERADRLSGLGKVFVLDDATGFVRAMLPVALSSGSVRIGLWLEVPVAQAETAIPVWDDPAYLDLRFTGTVANRVEPWGDRLWGARAVAVPTSADQLPYLVDGDEVVTSLLHEVWPRDRVVEAMPGLRHSH